MRCSGGKLLRGMVDTIPYTVYRVPMPTYKRRIVYLSDPLWRKLSLLAKYHGGTISGTIRDLITEPVDGEMLVWAVNMRDIEGKVIHHIDGDPENNDPDNLELRSGR